MSTNLDVWIAGAFAAFTVDLIVRTDTLNPTVSVQHPLINLTRFTLSTQSKPASKAPTMPNSTPTAPMAASTVLYSEASIKAWAAS
jgi:hypothetical protein